MTNYEWLQTAPLPSEIKVKNGGKYIPYRIIKSKLDKLCNNVWSTKRFVVDYVTLPKGRIMVSGTIELLVQYEYEGKLITRTLSGGCNFVLTRSSNVHPTATCKSLCIMNAVKVLGDNFGYSINEENESEDEMVNQLPVIKEEKVPIDKVRERHILMMQDSTTLEEVKGFELLSKTHKFTNEFKTKIKQLENGK